MKKYVQIILFFILVASIVLYNTQTGEDYLPEMKKLAGQESEINRITEQIYGVSQNNEIIGYFDQQSAIGYAGPIDVIIYISKDGKLKDLTVVKQAETPSFFNKVISEGFVENLIEKEASSQFELGQDLDGITGATYTSKAIAEAVRKASHNIAVTQLNMEVPKATGIKMPLEIYFALALLLAVFVLQRFKWSKLRYISLLAGFLLIGYWQKSLLTLGNIASVISGNISWQDISFWLILLFGVLLLIIITGRNLYCFWMCPYGALSELLGAFGKFGRMNYKPCPRSQRRFKHLRLSLAFGALVFAFLMKNPSISSYEIFAPLFAREGTSVQWFLLPIVLFAGVFIFRFWCRFFCPVGGILDFLVTLRRSCVQWLEITLKKKKLSRAQVILEKSHQERV